MRRLNDPATSPTYTTVAYWMEGDELVSGRSALPADAEHVILPLTTPGHAHGDVANDERTVYDIMRRLFPGADDAD
jgi:hypothetical protein